MKQYVGIPLQPRIRPIWILPTLGAILGCVIFYFLQLAGLPLYITGGVSVGLVLGIVASWMESKRVGLVLTEVTVSVAEFSDLRFVVNNQYRKVAWELFVETVTRVSTQPLTHENGSTREALTSFHSLFSTVRSLLREFQPTQSDKGTSVELLAIRMLNEIIRPLLSKWHPKLLEIERQQISEFEWPERSACRGEIEAARLRLLSYCRAFGDLARVQQLDKFLPPASEKATMPITN